MLIDRGVYAAAENYATRADQPFITLVEDFRNLQVASGSAYSWQISSTLQSPDNITLYGNETSTATFKVVAKRTPAGNGYTVSGRVVVSNPAHSEAISVESIRLMLGPGLPFFGPSPKTLDCRTKTLQPGDLMSCPFKVQLSSTSTKTLAPSVQVSGRRPLTG